MKKEQQLKILNDAISDALQIAQKLTAEHPGISKSMNQQIIGMINLARDLKIIEWGVADEMKKGY